MEISTLQIYNAAIAFDLEWLLDVNFYIAGTVIADGKFFWSTFMKATKGTHGITWNEFQLLPTMKSINLAEECGFSQK